MAYFPFFIDIKYKTCCIIGGGAVAYRKIVALLEFEAHIKVISPCFCDEIRQLKDRLHLIEREYQKEDLVDAFYVIAATDQPEINTDISKVCIERGILINAVDELDKCNFLFPAYVKRGDISIGVTTSGKSPVVAGHIKRSIQEKLPDYYEDLVNILGSYREYIKSRVASDKMRAAIFKELARIGIEQCGRITLEEIESVINTLGGNYPNGKDD